MSMIGRIADSPFTLPALVVAVLGLLAALLLPGGNHSDAAADPPPGRFTVSDQKLPWYHSTMAVRALKDGETGQEYLVVQTRTGLAVCSMSEGEDDGELATGND